MSYTTCQIYIVGWHTCVSTYSDSCSVCQIAQGVNLTICNCSCVTNYTTNVESSVDSTINSDWTIVCSNLAIYTAWRRGITHKLTNATADVAVVADNSILGDVDFAVVLELRTLNVCEGYYTTDNKTLVASTANLEIGATCLIARVRAADSVVVKTIRTTQHHLHVESTCKLDCTVGNIVRTILRGVTYNTRNLELRNLRSANLVDSTRDDDICVVCTI